MLPQHLGSLPLHHHRRRLVDSQAQQLRVLANHRGQVGESLALREVLVNRTPRQKGEAPAVAQRHHLGVPQRAPSYEELPLDRRSCRAPPNHPTPAQHIMEQFFGPGPFIRIDEPPLPAPAKPHPASPLETLDDRGIPPLVGTARHHGRHICRASPLKKTGFVRVGIGVRRGQHHDGCLFPPSQLQKPLDHLLRHPAPAHNHQAPRVEHRGGDLGRGEGGDCLRPRFAQEHQQV